MKYLRPSPGGGDGGRAFKNQIFIMEKKAIRIVSQSALSETDWTNPSGENVTIAKKEIEFSDGIDTFVAEATDQLARNLDKSPIPDGTVVNLQCALSVRNCKAKETGREWKVTNVRIQKIAVV